MVRKIIFSVLFGVFGLLPLSVSGQVGGNRIKGQVFSGNQPLDYFCVSLSSPADSLFLTGGAFEDGDFLFSGLAEDHYDVEISALGYVPFRQRIRIMDGTFDFGKILLTEDARQITAVTVVAERPLFKQEKGLLTVHVGGTMLEHAGTLFDVLQKSPGLIVDRNGTLQVFGRGEPVIYVDDREIVSREELEVLQSSDIDRIEIDRNPSSKYAASGHAVVRIRTRRSRTDHFSLSVYDRFTVSRKTGNVAGMQSDYKKNRWACLLNYAYENANHLDYNKSYERNTQPAGTIENLGDITNTNYRSRHTCFAGMEYRIGGNSRIGWQMDGYLQENGCDRKNIQQIRKSGAADIDKLILMKEAGRGGLYNTTVSYQLRPDEDTGRLDVVLGAAYTGNVTDIHTDEKRLPDFPSQLYAIKNRSAFSVYSATVDYRFRFLRFLDVDAGAKYAYVCNDGRSSQFDLKSFVLRYAQQSLIKDRTAAGYMLLKKELGKFNVSAGLRYERTASKTVVDAALVDTAYHDFFPSFLAGYTLGEQLDVSLSYARRIGRPGFRQINPNIIYLDSLSYGIGNPFLRPVYTNTVALNVSVRDLTFVAEYMHKRNYIIETAENDADNPDITRWSYRNLPKCRSLLLGGIYSRRWGFYGLNAEAYVEKPFVSVVYLNETLKLNKPSWMFSVSNRFTIRKNLSAECAYSYQSEGIDGITRCAASGNLSASVVWRLFRDRLRLSLSGYDLLDTINANTWEDRYKNIVTGMKSRQDNRYVRLEVRYNLHDVRSGVKNRANNGEELRRM